MTMQFIDISSNNHPDDQPINYKKVKKAGYGGVIIKATEGITYTNPWLKNDATSAHAAGLHVGYYHFAHPGESGSNNQANYALDAIHGLPRDVGLSLDLELQEGLTWDELTVWAKNFLTIVNGEGIGSPIYLNDNFLENLKGAPFGHKLWLASPGVVPRRTCWMWQKSWTGTVPGVVGQVDIDQYNG